MLSLIGPPILVAIKEIGGYKRKVNHNNGNLFPKSICVDLIQAVGLNKVHRF